MPWKASSVMEERLRFVARLLDGEAMTDVCREFGVSRKTGYKIFDRYREHWLAAELSPKFGDDGAGQAAAVVG
jgi:transposase